MLITQFRFNHSSYDTLFVRIIWGTNKNLSIRSRGVGGMASPSESQWQRDLPCDVPHHKSSKVDYHNGDLNMYLIINIWMLLLRRPSG